MMGMFSKKDKNRELEERLANEIIEESEKELQEQYANEIPAAVIMYTAADDETNGVNINTLCDNFRAAILPEPGSIVWCTTNGALLPYKCVRYDFFCNGSEIDSIRTYIVVEPARQPDILTHQYSEVEI